MRTRLWIPVLAASALGAGCAARQKTESPVARQQAGMSGQTGGQQYVQQLQQKACCEQRRAQAAIQRLQQLHAKAACEERRAQAAIQQLQEQGGAMGGGGQAGQQQYIEQLRQKASCEEQRAQAAIEQLQQQEQQLARLQEQQAQPSGAQPLPEAQAQAEQPPTGALGGGEQQAPQAQILPVPSSLFFVLDSADLTPPARQQLSEVVAALEQEPNASVRLEGHTDASGSAQRNEKLSQQRAENVRDFLVRQGVDAGRIQTEGRGESDPLASNSSSAGRAMNRRVDVRVETGQATGGSGVPSEQQQNVPPAEGTAPGSSDMPSERPLTETK